jgi:hypothetical protein
VKNNSKLLYYINSGHQLLLTVLCKLRQRCARFLPAPASFPFAAARMGRRPKVIARLSPHPQPIQSSIIKQIFIEQADTALSTKVIYKAGN